MRSPYRHGAGCTRRFPLVDGAVAALVLLGAVTPSCGGGGAEPVSGGPADVGEHGADVGRRERDGGAPADSGPGGDAAGGRDDLGSAQPDGGTPDGSGGGSADGGAPDGTRARVGDFLLSWEPATELLSVAHANDPERALWTSAPGPGWLRVGHADLHAEETRGSFRVDERVEFTCPLVQVQGLWAGAGSEGSVDLVGRLDDPFEEACAGELRVRFEQPSEGHLRLSVLLPPGSQLNVTVLRGALDLQEAVRGFGEQFSHVELRGHVVPVLSQEGGLGRGRWPISDAANLVSPGSGGDAFTTYAAMPYYLSSARRAFFLENTEYSVFDLSAPGRVVVRVHSGALTGRILFGRSPLELIERFTDYAGRMPEPPAWVDEGAIVGMQGGTERVRAVWQQLSDHGAPVAAFWLQDWVGRRQTSIGSQLWWHWGLDRQQYPGWEELVGDLGDAGVRVLGYVNPFLVDPAERCALPEPPPECDPELGYLGRNLFVEASEQGFLVQRAGEDGELQPYDLTVTDFPTYLVDLTHPGARAWLQEIIQTELLGAGLSGWMADFAEGLPFDARLHSGEPAARFHNAYPVAWARLNRDALEGAGALGDSLFFSRSGHTLTPGVTTALWAGDQMVTWDEHDGLLSALKGLISGGLSGLSIHHADAGGYTSASFELGGRSWGFTREKELLLRWVEVGAFTALLRTHEGNQPAANAQIYSDEESLAHFARMAAVYRALAPYRRRLFADAAQHGWPLVRHPVLHYPDDDELVAAGDRGETFLLGPELLVAPVLAKRARSRRVRLPAGRWTHLFSGLTYGSPDQGSNIEVAAPLGQPPVFFPAGAVTGVDLTERLRAAGVLSP